MEIKGEKAKEKEDEWIWALFLINSQQSGKRKERQSVIA